MLGAFKARVAPFNVNYRYVAEELRYLLNDAGAKAVDLPRSVRPDARRGAAPSCPSSSVLIQVADGSGHALLPGAVDYEEAAGRVVARAARPSSWSPDDLYILYTGGTTGMPKGVLWRQHDIFIGAMGGRPFGTCERVRRACDAIVETARERRRRPIDADAAAHARRRPVGHASPRSPAATRSCMQSDDTAASTRPTCGRIAERERVNILHDRRRRVRPAAHRRARAPATTTYRASCRGRSTAAHR